MWGFHDGGEPAGDRLLQARRRVPVVLVTVDTPERIAELYPPRGAGDSPRRRGHQRVGAGIPRQRARASPYGSLSSPSCNPPAVPHHVELKQFPRNSRSFNLSEAELSPLLTAWIAGAPFTWGELEWEPRKAKLTILRGPELATAELGQGRGWPQAQRSGEDVTEALLGRRP